jgi:hypothetical protein
VEQKAQSFPVLLQWWVSQNTRHRTLLAGMKVGGWKDVSDDAKEEAHEIELTRRQPGASGEILWHAKPLLLHADRVADVLQNKIYAAPALVPPSPWLCADAPGQPFLQARLSKGELKLTWKSSGGKVWQWVLQKKSGRHWVGEILAGAKTGETIQSRPGAPWPEEVSLCAVDRFGNVSHPSTYRPAP